MNSISFEHYIKQIDERLLNIVGQFNVSQELQDSIVYSITAGGKRLRPLIVLLILEDLGQDYTVALDVACAIEMIHTYSLIHDDLPSMDDDDYRRGKLTNHIVFGEAMAILAGDALLTESFNVIANCQTIDNDKKLRAIQILGTRAGANGMVAGQALDIISVDENTSFEDVKLIHHKKTKELIESALFIGALLADILDDNIDIMQEIANNLGLAFQVQDDLLDLLKDKIEIGKTPGSDEKNQKSTFPKVLGLEMSKDFYFDLRSKTLNLISDLFGKKNLYVLIERILHERF